MLRMFIGFILGILILMLGYNLLTVQYSLGTTISMAVSLFALVLVVVLMAATRRS